MIEIVKSALLLVVVSPLFSMLKIGLLMTLLLRNINIEQLKLSSLFKMKCEMTMQMKCVEFSFSNGNFRNCDEKTCINTFEILLANHSVCNCQLETFGGKKNSTRFGTYLKKEV